MSNAKLSRKEFLKRLGSGGIAAGIAAALGIKLNGEVKPKATYKDHKYHMSIPEGYVPAEKDAPFEINTDGETLVFDVKPKQITVIRDIEVIGKKHDKPVALGNKCGDGSGGSVAIGKYMPWSARRGFLGAPGKGPAACMATAAATKATHVERIIQGGLSKPEVKKPTDLTPKEFKISGSSIFDGNYVKTDGPSKTHFPETAETRVIGQWVDGENTFLNSETVTPDKLKKYIDDHSITINQLNKKFERDYARRNKGILSDRQIIEEKYAKYLKKEFIKNCDKKAFRFNGKNAFMYKHKNNTKSWSELMEQNGIQSKEHNNYRNPYSVTTIINSSYDVLRFKNRHIVVPFTI